MTPPTAPPRPARSLIMLLALMAITVSVIPWISEPATAAQPTTPPVDGLVRIDDVEAGALLFHSAHPGWYVPAPALHTDIAVAVSGPIARTQVTQRFRNVADIIVEGKYVFPLPEDSAVDTLRMRVGDRWIEGTIETYLDARDIYVEAKTAGQVASLVEQVRPNMFTTSVANIAPGNDVVVQIEYQQALAPTDGTFGLRIPLVVAPRYSSSDLATERAAQLVLGKSGWELRGTESVDAAVVSGTAGSAVRGSVDITIEIAAGFPIGKISSPYHRVRTTSTSAETMEVTVDSAGADHDFYLAWSPEDLAVPYAAAFREDGDGETHFVTMLTPPSLEAASVELPAREVVFVIDTSGSMDGTSITQAKAALGKAVERLTPQDRFNIIEFNSNHTSFAPKPVDASANNVTKALRFVDRLRADGGTEMYPALRDALRMRGNGDPRVRQVIFLTDGLVADEAALLRLIERELDDARLFTVAIGATPNSYFMSAAARAGRGVFVSIGNLTQVQPRMQELFAKIEHPAVIDITIAGFDNEEGADDRDEDAAVRISPWPIPDLYLGEPVVLTVRVPAGGDPIEQLNLVGKQRDRDWSLAVDLSTAAVRPGVSKLWARDQIQDLEHLRNSPRGHASWQQIDTQIERIALDYGLVSRLTSLVAVDVDASDSAETLPEGWDPVAFEAQQDDLSVDLDPETIDVELLNLLAEEPVVGDGSGVGLPQTGANWLAHALIGGAMIAVGTLGLRRTRRD